MNAEPGQAEARDEDANAAPAIKEQAKGRLLVENQPSENSIPSQVDKSADNKGKLIQFSSNKGGNAPMVFRSVKNNNSERKPVQAPANPIEEPKQERSIKQESPRKDRVLEKEAVKIKSKESLAAAVKAPNQMNSRPSQLRESQKILSHRSIQNFGQNQAS